MRPIRSNFCLYCRAQAAPISREHVVPEAFGKFGSNTLVLHCVCSQCNAHFSNEFERDVYRGSLEGVARWKFGLKPMQTRGKIHSGRIRVNAIGGKLDGLRLDPVTNDVEAQIVVGRRSGRGRVHLTLDELKRLKIDEAAKLDFSRSKLVIWEPKQKDEFAAELFRFGYGINEAAEMENIPMPAGTRLSARVTVSMDVKTGRAMAKIVFNYLARFLGAEYALRSCFDEIREFIRKGKMPAVGPVIASGMQENAKRPTPDNPSHFLTLHLHDSKLIYGRVALFSSHTYHVLVAPNCCGADVHPALIRGFGHRFDLRRKTVHRMPQSVIDSWNSLGGKSK